MDNVADAVARLRACTDALTAVTDPTAPASPPADLFARSLLSVWVGGLRSIAVTASAVSDSAAILSYPPGLVDNYAIDLAELLPGRTQPVTVKVTGVAWDSPNDTGILPSVLIPRGTDIPAPPAGAPDVVTASVRPTVQPEALSVTVQITTAGSPASPPVVVDVRLGTDNLIVDP